MTLRKFRLNHASLQIGMYGGKIPFLPKMVCKMFNFGGPDSRLPHEIRHYLQTSRNESLIRTALGKVQVASHSIRPRPVGFPIIESLQFLDRDRTPHATLFSCMHSNKAFLLVGCLPNQLLHARKNSRLLGFATFLIFALHNLYPGVQP